MNGNKIPVPSYQEGSKFPWIIDLEARDKYQIWVRFSDGNEGVIDLSDMVDHELFADWQKPGQFEQVKVGDYGELFWTEDASLCADSLYLDLTQQTLEEFMSR